MQTQERSTLQKWVLKQQYQTRHPYTQAAPGGWAWTDLSGGVPDADDTAGAILALRTLARDDQSVMPTHDEPRQAAARGARWLIDLQNRDGGIPTFCKGWGRFPFDQSSPDITAHALRAWNVWRNEFPSPLRKKTDAATIAAVEYLLKTQRMDGAWVPLWFGNQNTPHQHNPLYGTSRVLRVRMALPLNDADRTRWANAHRRAMEWILSAQNDDGGWGGDGSSPSSIEETALAVDALAANDDPDTCGVDGVDLADNVNQSVHRGCHYLVDRTNNGTQFPAAPIGLYFAKLWYTERLYPLIFTVSALERTLQSGSCDVPSSTAPLQSTYPEAKV